MWKRNLQKAVILKVWRDISCGDQKYNITAWISTNLLYFAFNMNVFAFAPCVFIKFLCVTDFNWLIRQLFFWFKYPIFSSVCVCIRRNAPHSFILIWITSKINQIQSRLYKPQSDLESENSHSWLVVQEQRKRFHVWFDVSRHREIWKRQFKVEQSRSRPAAWKRAPHVSEWQSICPLFPASCALIEIKCFHLHHLSIVQMRAAYSAAGVGGSAVSSKQCLEFMKLIPIKTDRKKSVTATDKDLRQVCFSADRYARGSPPACLWNLGL